MSAPVQIKKRDVVRKRGAKEVDISERLKRLKELHKRIAALPRIGPPLTDADLYDEDGIPQ